MAVAAGRIFTDAVGSDSFDVISEIVSGNYVRTVSAVVRTFSADG